MATLVRKIMGAGIPAGTASTLLGDVQDSLTATGTSQSDAQNIGSAIAIFTTVASGTGGILPLGAIGDEVLVLNEGANALSLYPPVGHRINSGSTNAAISIAPSAALIIKRIRNLFWLAQDASQLFFLQAGTGAVPRTVQGKLRDIVSVKDFGAKGDESQDDIPFIQLAVDRLVAAGGGICYFPPGMYLKTTSTGITATKGVQLLGSGIGVASGAGNYGGSVIRDSAAGGDVITFSAADSCMVRDIAIDAPSVTKSANTAGIRIQGSGGSGNVNRRSRVENCRITNMYDAIYWDTASDCVVSNCHIQDYLNIGVYSKQTGGTDSGHNTIANCVIWDLNVGTSQANIRYDKGGDLRIIANKLLGSTYGLRVELDDGETGTLLMTGNSFEEHLTNDIRINQATVSENLGNVIIVGNQFSTITPATPQSNIAIVAGTAGGGATCWVKNITISSNVFNNAHNANFYIISVQDGEGVTVIGNVLNANGNANPDGIDVGGNAASATVLGNQMVDMPGTQYSASTQSFMSAEVSAVKFPSTQVSSSNVNTLDDYEEGTWTPVATFATPGDLNVVYSAQVGSYTKIGNMCRASCRVTTSTFTHSTASGNFQITGFPFAAANVANNQHIGALMWAGITKAGVDTIVARIDANASLATLLTSGTGAANAAITTAEMPTGGSVVIVFTIVYQTAT